MWHDARPPSPTPGSTSVPHLTHGVAIDHNGSFSPDPPVGGTPGGLTVNDPPEPTPRPTRAAISQVEPESMSAERQGQAPGGAVPVATPYYPVDPAITPSGHHVRPAPSAAAKLAPGGDTPVATPYYPVDPDYPSPLRQRGSRSERGGQTDPKLHPHDEWQSHGPAAQGPAAAVLGLAPVASPQHRRHYPNSAL